MIVPEDSSAVSVLPFLPLQWTAAILFARTGLYYVDAFPRGFDSLKKKKKNKIKSNES